MEQIVDPITYETVPEERVIVINDGNSSVSMDIEVLIRHVLTNSATNPFTRNPLSKEIMDKMRGYRDDHLIAITVTKRDNKGLGSARGSHDFGVFDGGVLIGDVVAKIYDPSVYNVPLLAFNVSHKGRELIGMDPYERIDTLGDRLLVLKWSRDPVTVDRSKFRDFILSHKEYSALVERDLGWEEADGKWGLSVEGQEPCIRAMSEKVIEFVDRYNAGTSTTTDDEFLVANFTPDVVLRLKSRLPMPPPVTTGVKRRLSFSDCEEEDNPDPTSRLTDEEKLSLLIAVSDGPLTNYAPECEGFVWSLKKEHSEYKWSVVQSTDEGTPMCSFLQEFIWRYNSNPNRSSIRWTHNDLLLLTRIFSSHICLLIQRRFCTLPLTIPTGKIEKPQCSLIQVLFKN